MPPASAPAPSHVARWKAHLPLIAMAVVAGAAILYLWRELQKARKALMPASPHDDAPKLARQPQAQHGSQQVDDDDDDDDGESEGEFEYFQHPAPPAASRVPPQHSHQHPPQHSHRHPHRQPAQQPYYVEEIQGEASDEDAALGGGSGKIDRRDDDNGHGGHGGHSGRDTEDRPAGTPEDRPAEAPPAELKDAPPTKAAIRRRSSSSSRV